jgi:hypothetical protein
MSQRDLAEAVNTWLAGHAGRDGALDDHYVGRLERGVVRRPGRDYRTALRAVLSVATDAQLGFAAASRRPRPVMTPDSCPAGPPMGSDYVETLRASVARFVSLDTAIGGGAVADSALEKFRGAQAVLGEGRYEPRVERDLETATAELGELSGWLLFDSERHSESRQVNAEALNLARIAGDRSMEWFILSNQALASVHTGRDREALRISEQMLVNGDELPTRVRALFDVRKARALAALGDETGALAAFDRARSAFSESATRRDPAWAWWFDLRELAGHEGMIHAALGKHDLALPRLAQAVEQSEGRDHFRWALYIHRANLLRALLRVGDWREADRVATALVPMVGEVRSTRTEGILTRLGSVSGPSSLTDLVRWLAESAQNQRDGRT